MPRDRNIKKILIVGAGADVVGQSAEFDNAGVRSLGVFRKAGIFTVLLDPDPACVMTDGELADAVYLEPLTVNTVKRLIEKERPDALFASFGGENSLAIALELSRKGFLDDFGVKLIGVSEDTISRTKDAELFRKTLEGAEIPSVPYRSAADANEACAAAEKLGYPVTLRSSAEYGKCELRTAHTPRELRIIVSEILGASHSKRVIVEKYIFGRKEIEIDVLRDKFGSAAAVCSIENIDPVGIHSGDSAQVTPVLTLSAGEYDELRSMAIKTAAALGAVGWCGVRFAVAHDEFEYVVTEATVGFSRGASFAERATGYPIAYTASDLALGCSLDEVKIVPSGKQSAFFEPKQDYVALRLPKWPFDKFAKVSRLLGQHMKSTGAAVAAAPCFEAALIKAVRGTNPDSHGLHREYDEDISLEDRLENADDLRLFTIFEALSSGVSAEEIRDITNIDSFFINKIKHISDFEKELAKGLDDEKYIKAKKLGYTDLSIEKISGDTVRRKRAAVYKAIDACGQERSEMSPCFYSTYDDVCESRKSKRSGGPIALVVSSGPVRIGAGAEFDYSAVRCIKTLRSLGYEVALISCDPDGVSADHGLADRVYLEPSSEEDVLNVFRAESAVGVFLPFGTARAARLAEFLISNGVRVFGADADIIFGMESVRVQEILKKFAYVLPETEYIKTNEAALRVCEKLGYPVVLRPEHLSSGQNIVVAKDDKEVKLYVKRMLDGGTNSVIADKYMEGKELEITAISDGKDVLIPAVIEHIERAGVLEGDSVAVYPPYDVSDKIITEAAEIAEKIAVAIGVRGMINLQLLIYKNALYVTDISPFVSRSLPFISKASGIPAMDIAVKVMAGSSLASIGAGKGICPVPPYVAVKAPVYSFEKLTDAGSYIGPRMKATGQTMGVGRTFYEAFYKAFCAAGFEITREKGVLLSAEKHYLPDLPAIARKFESIGARIYATSDTARWLGAIGINAETVRGVRENDDGASLLNSGKIGFVLYAGALYDSTVKDYIALHRRALKNGALCFSSLPAAMTFAKVLRDRYNDSNTELVDLNNRRKERAVLRFSKMQGCGDDYIFIDNFDGSITSPESLCIAMCDRHYGVGADGVVLIERSNKADARIRIFNRDGSESAIAGNCIRCTAKYLYDKNICAKSCISVETVNGVRHMNVYTGGGKVTYVTVNMGRALLAGAELPCTLQTASGKIIGQSVNIGGTEQKITCVSMGSPHCVVFYDKVEGLDINSLGKAFLQSPIFPEGVNTEFVRVIDSTTIKMRVYEKVCGETFACGTGACAAVVAACENGYCEKGKDITVKLNGGDLVVNYKNDGVTLSGDAKFVYDGVTEY